LRGEVRIRLHYAVEHHQQKRQGRGRVQRPLHRAPSGSVGADPVGTETRTERKQDDILKPLPARLVVYGHADGRRAGVVGDDTPVKMLLESGKVDRRRAAGKKDIDDRLCPGRGAGKIIEEDGCQCCPPLTLKEGISTRRRSPLRLRPGGKTEASSLRSPLLSYLGVKSPGHCGLKTARPFFSE
jgi:hypothetical protein